jgi:hypothetical protein
MFSQQCIKCCEEYGSEECEVPIERNGTLLLSTLESVFPGAKGKVKNMKFSFVGESILMF